MHFYLALFLLDVCFVHCLFLIVALAMILCGCLFGRFVAVLVCVSCLQVSCDNAQ